MEVNAAVVMITGGGSGLGAASAKEFAKGGARIVLVDLPSSPGLEVLRTLDGQGIFAPADVTSEAEVNKAISAATAKFGGIHVLINCAGIATAERVLTKEGPASLKRFTKIIEVNLIGTFNVIRLVAAAMAKNTPGADGERGVIINTASVAAFEGQIGQAAYSASKGGVMSMTLPIARDLASIGVRVCTIAPGTFETPMLATLPEPVRKALEANIPFPHRLGKASEYAILARHIVENPMLNGETIRLDGALRMPPK
ncbi:MAG TPA: SDR family NAD(P)-dependent oxidoreductase [Candidatus Binataceae bacterium]|nr:SDR family NAD(P)-dependent oxidoreductase [Candidatus Binataceae bacterium]